MSTILIVEDDANQRNGLRILLESAGYRIRVAADGLDALRQIEKEHFDLLLVDVWLPRLNGLDLLARLPAGCRPKVILMTADNTTQTLLRALRERAFQFITKPFDPKLLAELILRTLESPPAVDDVQVLSAEPQWVELQIPGDLQTAERIENFLRLLDSDLRPEVRDSVEMAFHELLTNAIEWGGHLDPDSKVQVTCLRTKRLLLYRIADSGEGFEPENLEHAAVGNPPEHSLAHMDVREAKGLRPGGFGIMLAKSLVDDVVYNEAHNEVVLLKFLS